MYTVSTIYLPVNILFLPSTSTTYSFYHLNRLHTFPTIYITCILLLTSTSTSYCFYHLHILLLPSALTAYTTSTVYLNCILLFGIRCTEVNPIKVPIHSLLSSSRLDYRDNILSPHHTWIAQRVRSECQGFTLNIKT